MEFSHRFFMSQDFALINPMQIDADIVALWPSEPIVPDALKGQEKHMPRLIALAELDEDDRLYRLDQTMNYGSARNKAPFCGLLRSPASPSRVARHVQSAMVQKIGGEAMWLRLHDPRVWLNLRWILRPFQVDALLGPISHWSWPVPGSEHWTASTREREAAQRLDLDIDQMRALSMTGSVNRVFARLARDGAPVLDTDASRRTAFDEMMRAQALGLSTDEDVEFFAFLSLVRSPQVHDQPVERRMIDLAVAGECGYLSAWMDEYSQSMELNAEELDERGNN